MEELIMKHPSVVSVPFLSIWSCVLVDFGLLGGFGFSLIAVWVASSKGLTLNVRIIGCIPCQINMIDYILEVANMPSLMLQYSIFESS